jgi:uncharacterized protein
MSETPPLLSRRTFLATGAVLAAGAAIPSALLSNTTDKLEITEHGLSLPGLPPAFEGYRIAQVSDVHLYDGYHPAAVQTLEALKRARADLIVVTGDMWDSAAGCQVTHEWLQEMPKNVPSVAILGNHEYNHLPAGVRPETAYKKAGIPLLVNDTMVIEHRGERMALVGLDDLRHGTPYPARAWRALPEGVVECWLIHEPGMLDRMTWPEWATVRFSLLGHTHGGQVRIPGLPPVRPSGSGSYLAGAYTVAGVQAYVSRGIGTSGLHMRLNCSAELPIFTLTAKA